MFLWMTLAYAGVPLVYESDASQALSQAVAVTGLPDSQFELVTLGALLKQPPQVTGAAVIRHCAGTLTRSSDLVANAIRAEAAWKLGQASQAMDELDLGIGGLGCLGERVDAPSMSRMFLLRGGLLAMSGREEEARNELRSALSMGDISEWPSHFPPEGALLFQEVRTERERVELVVWPAGITAAPGIDGATVAAGTPLLLRPGLHLLQVPGTSGLRSAWLTVRGPAQLVVPANYREPILGRLLDVPLQEEVEVLLLSALESEAVYVWHQGSLFLITQDSNGTYTNPLLLAPPPPPPETEKRGKKKKN